MVEIDRRKAALIAELEVSRGEIRSAARACEESLDLVSLLRGNVRDHLKIWLPGALLGGWVVSKLLTRRLESPRIVRPETERRPSRSTAVALVLGLGKVAFDLAKPALIESATAWLARSTSGLSKGQAAKTAATPFSPAKERGDSRNGDGVGRSPRA